METIIESDVLDIDRKALINVSKPLFYGYIFLSGIMMYIGSDFAGTMFGLAIVSSLTFISAAISEGMKTDWRKFLDLLAIMTLLIAVLFGSYISLAVSMGMMGI